MKMQQGMTVIGMLFTMFVTVLFGMLVIQTVPVYLQYYSIRESIVSLSSIPTSAISSDVYADRDFLRGSLNKRLDINGVDFLKQEQIKILPDGPNKFRVKLKYQVTKPLVYNVNLLFDFDETYEVKVGGEH